MANVIPKLNEDMQARAKRNPQLWQGTRLSVSSAGKLKYPDDFKLPPAAGTGASPCTEEIVPPHPLRASVVSPHETLDEDLEIARMLAGGFGRLSQTYLCKRRQASTQLVLKLFQQEYMPYPVADDGWMAVSLDEVYNTWPLAENLYSTEALAYERLRGYRGTRLPYSYGFYRLTLPSGDVTVGHLMEYIDHPLPYELENAESIDWIEFMKQFIDCLLDFKKHGVEHSDLAARNIRAFRDDDDSRWEFILLDWASANFEWDKDYGFKDWWTLSTLANDVEHLVVRNSPSDPALWLWEEGKDIRSRLLDKSRHGQFPQPKTTPAHKPDAVLKQNCSS